MAYFANYAELIFW